MFISLCVKLYRSLPAVAVLCLLWLITSTSQYEIMARGFPWSCWVWINLHSLGPRPSADEETQTRLKLHSQTLQRRSKCSHVSSQSQKVLNTSIWWRGHREHLAGEEKNVMIMKLQGKKYIFNLKRPRWLWISHFSAWLLLLWFLYLLLDWLETPAANLLTATVSYNYVAHRLNHWSWQQHTRHCVE